ncbi:polyphosphate:AMP phosphotransferase [Methanolobus sp. ZRKC3]|uniref:polyphosphate:AMP phosphotransferase n=1 Tax=Methanolobus sp. ZRKC3 TaxID=3125786 RepID=UPI0032471467
MLEQIDLSRSMEKKDYLSLIDKLKIRMGEVQREAWKNNIPVIVVFEGWHASGMTDIINRFLLPLNPMGFELYTTGKPCTQEEEKPFLWRFWTKIPKKGNIAIFDRSWYRRAIIEHSRKNKNGMEKCVKGINYFEKQLVDDGYLIVKFFLHVSKEKQQKRFEEIRKKKIPLFIVEDEKEQDFINKYENYFQIIDKTLEKTDIPAAPWILIESDDLNYATIKIMTSFIEAVEENIQLIEKKQDDEFAEKREKCIIPAQNLSTLKDLDLSGSLSPDEYRKKKKHYQKKLASLQYKAFEQKRPIITIFEGWDASGKGGSIRRLVQKLNPRLYRVVPIGVPTDHEIARHYLWRFYNEMLEAGHIAVFDRSWYGRVLVERVECICSEQEWSRAYREINEFEETLANYGTIIIKFWMHIDKHEQLERFKQRETIPYKKWKITPDDWKNREKWNLYEDAVEEMLQKNSTIYAPWTIIGSNNKYYSRIEVLQKVVETLEKELA